MKMSKIPILKFIGISIELAFARFLI